jgi:hypothetical protein
MNELINCQPIPHDGYFTGLHPHSWWSVCFGTDLHWATKHRPVFMQWISPLCSQTAWCITLNRILFRHCLITWHNIKLGLAVLSCVKHNKCLCRCFRNISFKSLYDLHSANISVTTESFPTHDHTRMGLLVGCTRTGGKLKYRGGHDKPRGFVTQAVEECPIKRQLSDTHTRDRNKKIPL